MPNLRLSLSDDADTSIKLRIVRFDVAPGEPESLMNTYEIAKGETIRLQLYPGSKIIIAERNNVD